MVGADLLWRGRRPISWRLQLSSRTAAWSGVVVAVVSAVALVGLGGFAWCSTLRSDAAPVYRHAWAGMHTATTGGGVRAASSRHGLLQLRALSEVEASKIDGMPDELFYILPRIGVYHVDDSFRAQLTELYRLLLKPGGNILDLCSQHDSHLPQEVEYESITVHGMNYLELLANKRATDRFTHNFNSDASLSRFDSGSFDAVAMAVSIQYMQKPVDLLKEIRRVLKPGGVVVVSFSNRMFFTKAVDAWRSKRTMRGLADLVLGYFAEAGLGGVQAANGVRAPGRDVQGDPFLAVVGFKGDAPDGVLDQDGLSWLPSAGAGSIWSRA